MTMITEEIVQKAKEYALSETEKYGTPPIVMLDLVEKISIKLAVKLGAGVDIVRVATYLMDLKLGEALTGGKLAEHVKMSAEASKDFLENFNLDKVEFDKIINCVEAHHGKVPYTCLEAEIIANADCYKFIHPTGVFSYFPVLAERKLEFNAILDQVEEKMDEKYAVLSLAEAKEELEPYYQTFKKYLQIARG